MICEVSNNTLLISKTYNVNLARQITFAQVTILVEMFS
jgi:hypothetical protein